MIYKLYAKSKQRLATCDALLQTLFYDVGSRYRCAILEGHRGEEKQNKYFDTGKSKVQWPNGKHNKIPSQAVDVAPLPICWDNDLKNLARFYHFAGFVMARAMDLGIKIRGGHDWDGDRNFKDQTFDDLVHFELI